MPAPTGPSPAHSRPERPAVDRRRLDAPLRLIELPDGGLMIDVRSDPGPPDPGPAGSDENRSGSDGDRAPLPAPPASDRRPVPSGPSRTRRPGPTSRGPGARAGGGRVTVQADPINWSQLAGRTMVGLGLLMVAFAAFQLWGTALLESRAQQGIEAELAAHLNPRPTGRTPVQLERSTTGSEPGAAPAGRASGQPAPTADPEVRTPVAPLPPVVLGQPVGRIEIPAIGLSKVFLEGVDRDTLRGGPGHYPGTALPGHAGNTAIAGHRTTHGAPFQDLDQLDPGDEITLETPEGLFRYLVEGHTGADGSTVGHLIVDPGDVAVLADMGDNRLTLTACHPKFSARQRIVVTAVLVGPALTEPVPVPVGSDLDSTDGTDGTSGAGSAGAVTPVAIPAAVSQQAEQARLPAAPIDPATPAAVTPSPATPDDPSATVGVGAGALHASLGWQHEEIEPTVLWATVTSLVAHGAWALGRLWRRRAAYGLALPLVGTGLFLCFVHLDRLLPAF